MADIYCTLIASLAQVEAARAAGNAIPGGRDMFDVPLRPIGGGPISHYVSSGFVRPAIHDAMIGLCDITTGEHTAAAVIAAAGLEIATPAVNG